MKTSVFSRVRMVFTEKTGFLLSELSQCFSTSEVIIDVNKQNRNIMMSTLCAYHTERKQIFQQIKIIMISERSLLSK